MKILSGHRRAFAAGVLGTLVMSIFLGLLRVSGLASISFELGLGGRITGEGVDPLTFAIGFVLCLFTGGLLGLALSGVMRRLKYSGWLPGGAFGVLLWIVVAFLIGTFPVLDVQAPVGALPLGPFAIHDESLFAFYTLLLAYLVYGAVVGRLIE